MKNYVFIYLDSKNNELLRQVHSFSSISKARHLASIIYYTSRINDLAKISVRRYYSKPVKF